MAARDSFRNAIVFAVLCAMLLSSAPYAVQTQAQMSATCARELDRQDRELQAFEREVKKQNLDFASDDAVGQSLTDMKDLAKGQPDQIALRKLIDLKEKVVNLAKELMTFEEMMAAMGTCLKSGPPHCLSDLAGLQSAQYRRWLQALAEENLSGAVERVNKARSLVQDYAAKTMSMAQGSITRGLDACIDETQQAVDSNKATIDTRSPRPAGGGEIATVPPPSEGGWNGFMTTAVVLGVVGGGAYLFKDQIAALIDGNGAGGCGAEPVLDFSACFSGQASSASCTSNLAKLEAYCQSCGQKRGLNQFATTCVAK